MTNLDSAFRDLVKKVKNLTEDCCWCNFKDDDIVDYPSINNMICLNNQFYFITQFPSFRISAVSPNIEMFIPYDMLSQQLNSKSFYSIIHHEDAPIVLLATQKMTELINCHYDSIRPYEAVFSMDFRIRTKENVAFSRFLNQNCIIYKKDCCVKYVSISLFTDISKIKNSKKIEFNCNYYGQGPQIEFPDEELKNFARFFTNRELEIISLLALGKSSYEIGDILNISKHTVDTHRRKMLAKSHLCNTAKLVAFSIENEMIDF